MTLLVEDGAVSHINRLFYNFKGESKYQRASKSHYWLKTYSNLATKVISEIRGFPKNMTLWWLELSIRHKTKHISATVLPPPSALEGRGEGGTSNQRP